MKVYRSVCVVYHPDCIKELVAEVDTIKELNAIINDTKEHYARIMPAINEVDSERLNGIMIDYGSWTNFLYVDGITFEEYVAEDRKNVGTAKD